MSRVCIVKSGRCSLIPHLQTYFETFTKYDADVVDFKSTDTVYDYKKEIANNDIEYFVYSNGTDKIDRLTKQTILEINPLQKFLFSENAWLTWQNFLYLDPCGIGNESELFGLSATTLRNMKVNPDLYDFCSSDVDTKLKKGDDIDTEGYILVPLQVDGDSKLNVGSPYFKTVSEFVDYMIDITPPDVKILFKNHPHNKKRVEIPEKKNVIDITTKKFSKKSLIKNSMFVAGINSTFLIESMFLKHRTITYGLDVFSNKNIIVEGVGKTFASLMEDDCVDYILRDKFMHCLMSRQIPKKQIYKLFSKINHETGW